MRLGSACFRLKEVVDVEKREVKVGSAFPADWWLPSRALLIRYVDTPAKSTQKSNLDPAASHPGFPLPSLAVGLIFLRTERHNAQGLKRGCGVLQDLVMMGMLRTDEVCPFCVGELR